MQHEQASIVFMTDGFCAAYILDATEVQQYVENRRAFILNFRPQEMIDFERAKGFGYLGKQANRSLIT